MIKTLADCQNAFEAIRCYEGALDSLEQEIAEANPRLFVISQKSYRAKIKQLNEEVVSYLRSSPGKSNFTIGAMGESVGYGSIPIRFLSSLLDNVQSAVNAAGMYIVNVLHQYEIPHGTSIRDLLRINAVATAPGSFNVSLAFEPVQMHLFNSIELGESSLQTIIDELSNIQNTTDIAPDKVRVIRSLEKMTSLLDGKRVKSLRLSLEKDNRIMEIVVTTDTRRRIYELFGKPEFDEITIRGTLYEIDTLHNTFKFKDSKNVTYHCYYLEVIEDDLLHAMKGTIEVTGKAETDRAKTPTLRQVKTFHLVSDKLD
jgi:hypothetical protein